MITEQERKEILSKYLGNTSDELLTYLKRNFPVHENKLDWMEKPWKQISIDSKSYMLDKHKKFLVNKISSYIEDEWIHLPVEIRRRTVKKYIDGISL
jgi:hypothetical protein